jgi:hypothetical protein
VAAGRQHHERKARLDAREMECFERLLERVKKLREHATN